MAKQTLKSNVSQRFSDKKAEYTRDSTKMENSMKTMDSIGKANKNAMLLSPQDSDKYKAAKDTFYAAAGRTTQAMKKKK